MNAKPTVLQAFPELEQLGQAKLQRLSDDWIATAIAREFAVSALEVHEEANKLLLPFEAQVTYRVQNHDDYYFPMDELLTFIAEHGIANLEMKDAAKARIRRARQDGGPDVFRRFKVYMGPKLPLFVTCQNAACGEVLQTPFSAYRAEKLQFDAEEIECPACRTSFVIDGDALHFEPGT